MTVIYRIRLHPFEGEDLLYEGFGAKSDADAFWEETVGNEGLLSKIPCESAILTYEELCHGTWVAVSTKLVIR